MNYSSYQNAFFNTLLNEECSIVLNAKAGSGKTSTIVAGANMLGNKKTLFIAFNKKIVNELSFRLPSSVVCRTFNSVGYAAWRNHIGKKFIEITDSKTADIIKKKFTKEDSDCYGRFVLRMIPVAKSSGLTPESVDQDWINWQEHYNISSPESGTIERAIDLCRKVLAYSISIADRVCDFDDQIYMPWLKGAAFDHFDAVFVDEGQDMNFVQRDILSRFKCRIIVVGDPRQAIYGFRGSDSNSMTEFANQFSAKILPLSVCYRCGKNIIEFARNYVSDIEPFENADDGKVEHIISYTKNTFKLDDAIICRKNAPLIKFAYSLLSRQIPINFIGRDLAEGLINIIKSMKVDSIEDKIDPTDENSDPIQGLNSKLLIWKGKQIDKYMERGKPNLAEAINDKYNCINIFIDNLNDDNYTVAGLLSEMNKVFSGDRGITLCSVHRSKGLEWDRVFILDFGLMPMIFENSKEWMIEQENNLIYVAITRAKNYLGMINSDCWSD